MLKWQGIRGVVIRRVVLAVVSAVIGAMVDAGLFEGEVGADLVQVLERLVW